MDREKLLYAMGEVDEDVLYFQYHLKNVLGALLMGLLTIILCLFVAERILGVSGFVKDVCYYAPGDTRWTIIPHLKIGLWFRRVLLIVLPVLFAGKVRWRYTWVNLFLFIGMYFPMKALAGQWPAMGYLGDNSGILAPPQIVNPFVMAFHFWGVQSIVFAGINLLRYVRRNLKNT